MARCPFFFAMLWLTVQAWAQTSPNSGQITGIVKDPDQAVVVGAQVVLTNQQTKGKVSAQTDSQGAFLFSSLEPGAYLVEVNSKGFQTLSKEVTVSAGQAVNADFALTIAAAAQNVTVSAGTVENAYRVDTVKPEGP